MSMTSAFWSLDSQTVLPFLLAATAIEMKVIKVMTTGKESEKLNMSILLLLITTDWNK